eukprot:2694890-Prymnesium_polylepis.1
MPFGYLLATLAPEEQALKAADDDPNRKLPELVYSMFVPLSRRISRVNDAKLVRLLVKVRHGATCVWHERRTSSAPAAWDALEPRRMRGAGGVRRARGWR